MITDWSMHRLGDIAITQSGGTPSRSNGSFFNGEIPWVKSGELNDSTIYTSKEKITDEAIKSSSAKIFEPNTLLLAMYGATVGKTGILKIRAATNQAVCAIRPQKNNFNIDFLKFYLIFIRPQLLRERYGGAQPNISQTLIQDLQIPLPSIEEQKNIAALLFKIQQAIEIQESIIEKTRELKKSTIHHIFTHGLRGEKLKETEIGPMPESWDVLPVGKVYDFTKKPKEIIYSNYDHLPFIAMDLIPIDSPHLSKFKLKKTTEISSGTYIEDGDILLAKITPCFENGKQCIITGLPDGFGIASTEIIPIKEKSGVSDKYFLYFYLLKDDVRTLIAGKMEGATGRQRVPIRLIRDLLIPFPSLSDQNKIAKLFLTIDEKIEVHTAKKSTLQDLFKTMLNKLMTGEIRVKDLEMELLNFTA